MVVVVGVVVVAEVVVVDLEEEGVWVVMTVELEVVAVVSAAVDVVPEAVPVDLEEQEEWVAVLVVSVEVVPAVLEPQAMRSTM